jgi:hypothetical protein
MEVTETPAPTTWQKRTTMTAIFIMYAYIRAALILLSLPFRFVRLWWQHGRIMTLSQMEREAEVLRNARWR